MHFYEYKQFKFRKILTTNERLVLDLKSSVSKRERMRIVILVATVLLAAASFAIGTILRRAEERRAESVFHGATLVMSEVSCCADGDE